MLKKLLNLTASTAIFGIGVFGYLRYKTAKNAKQYEAIQNAGTLRDASRLSNDSFGISWGFQADDIIMNKIDSGDFLFIKYECSQCLSVPEYLNCFRSSMLNLDEQFDSVGYAYRNQEALYILYNQFGETRVRKYDELVGLPYLKELMIQKNNSKGPQIHNKLKACLQDQQGKVKSISEHQTSIELVNRMNRYLFNDSVQPINDLRELYVTDQQIHVRTETNRTLRSL